MRVRSVVLASFMFGVLSVSSAHAGSYTSAYSDLDLDDCRIVEEESEVGFVQLKCEGRYGYDVYATEADLRFYLTFRQKGAPLIIADPDDPNAGQDDYAPPGARPIGETIPSFNKLGPKLEWRTTSRSGGEPFATIVRYYYQKVEDDGSYGTGQVLVVSRFRSGDTCHVSYIDAEANSNANEMARDVADKYATGGECPDGAVPVLGEGGHDFRF